MKTKSLKEKGKRLQKKVCSMISDCIGIPYIPNNEESEIQSKAMGLAGVDVILNGTAKKLFPYSVECKNSQTWSLPSYIKQAEANTLKNTDWLLFLSKNNQKNPYVVMDSVAFFKLVKKCLKK